MTLDADMYPPLEQGNTGPAVARLQSNLVSNGFHLSIDGVFGAGTRRALADFQVSRKMFPTGIADSNTWAALLEKAPQSPTGSAPNEFVDRLTFGLHQCRVEDFNSQMWAPALAAACVDYEINTVNRISGFIANVVHESNRLSGVLVENLNYSATALTANWPNRFTRESANRYGRTEDHAADQRMIAILAYGGRMGNAPAPSSDGWDFRGRGPIQITGRDNYTRFFEYSGIDVVNDPELVLKPSVGAKAAAWFFKSEGLNKIADSGDWRLLRRRINGGTNGMDDVLRLTNLLLPVFSE